MKLNTPALEAREQLVAYVYRHEELPADACLIARRAGRADA